MAQSNPTIVSTDIPTQVPPRNQFQITATIRQAGPDPVASHGSCTSKNLDIMAWRTPVELHVDGDKVAADELCLAAGSAREVSLSTSLSPGSHDVKLVVYSMGGNSYDLKGVQKSVSDDVTATIQTNENATDPSRPGALDSILRRVKQVLGGLGGRTQMIALGGGLALAFLALAG
jgi:hypothetical protein